MSKSKTTSTPPKPEPESTSKTREYAAKAADKGARAGAATALRAGARHAATSLGKENLKQHVAGLHAGAALALGAVNQAVDTVQLARGEIDGGEYGARTVRNSGAAGGGIGGAAAGAAVGTALVPGVGTTVGAVVGGVVGGVAGSKAGRKLGQWIFLGTETPNPEVLAVLNDPSAFDPAAHQPRFRPVPWGTFVIDHHQEGTFLVTFAQDGARYLLILHFDRFNASATLARQGGTRVRHAVGAIHFDRLVIPFHIGRPLVFEFRHATHMFRIREASGQGDPGRAVPFEVYKRV